jgi:hypothetical protein
MEDEGKEEPDFDAFSLSKILQECKSVTAQNPQWNSKLSMPNLPLLLKNQNCTYWWLPGEKTMEDYDEDEDNDDDDDKNRNKEQEEEEEVEVVSEKEDRDADAEDENDPGA